jgi:hypothetical protein
VRDAPPQLSNKVRKLVGGGRLPASVGVRQRGVAAALRPRRPAQAELRLQCSVLGFDVWSLRMDVLCACLAF